MKNRKILLVDDEKAILKVFGWDLRKEYHAVTLAGSGEEAAALLHEGRFDLVITDLVMPGMNGLQVLAAAKNIHGSTGVIILTGKGELASALEALRLGADDCLLKPCTFEELHLCIERSFEKQDLLSILREKNEQLESEISYRKIVESELQSARDHLEQQVREGTAALINTVDQLNHASTALQVSEEELSSNNRELNEINSALGVLLKRRENERAVIKQEIAADIVASVLPLLKRSTNMVSGSARYFLETAQVNLADIFAQHSPGTLLQGLAPRELQVVNYIRQGKSSKEIADLLGLSDRTVESYRDNIRNKLGIRNQKKSLRKFITSLP